MASKKVPRIQAQAVIEKCHLCDRGEDETFFCTNCNEEMCKYCKITHLRSKATRNHNIIRIAVDKDTLIHDATINCIVHLNEPVRMFCTNCEVLVCLTCIAGKHNKHAFDKIACSTEGLVDLTEKLRHLKTDTTNVQTSTSQEQDANIMKAKSSKAIDTSEKSSTVDQTVLTEFKTKQKLSCISVVGNNRAWMSGYGSNNVTLVDIDGNVIKNLQLDINVRDITATSQGEVFVTEFLGQQIKKYNTEGICVTVSNMSPLYTQGLCITADEDLLICLRSVDDKKVVRMTLNGQVKQTIQYDQHKQPLYRDSRLVTENMNGDVCVVDGANRLSRVVVVNKDGVLRFRYPDKAESSDTIGTCYGIACDSFGFILFSDFTYNEIHQIDIDGRFIQSILTEPYGVESPRGLDVDTAGKLWICNEVRNKLKVVKYRS